MTLQTLFQTPGEHALMLEGCVGSVEAILTVPESCQFTYVALLGHPHSLQGGTMQNKVVTTLARTFSAVGIISVRFNFRGVGQSAGVYDAGVGESEDMLQLAKQLQVVLPTAGLIFAGFSFGSYVAYRAATLSLHALLITIAPPVERFDYTVPRVNQAPWIVVQGSADEVTPMAALEQYLTETEAQVIFMCFENTGHFFHGELVTLKTRLMQMIQEKLV
jgi:alpha/beta superfamily hydrolase